MVDDEADMRMLAEIVLKKAGFDVLSAGSAENACKLVRERRAALVLLDWDLKEAGLGSEVVEVCQEVDRLLPVIVMSGSTKVDARTDALSKGAVSFLQKPFSNDMLVEHVRFTLDRRRATGWHYHLQSEEDIIPLEDLRRQYAGAVVAILHGNKKKAAEVLGVHRSSISTWLRK